MEMEMEMNELNLVKDKAFAIIQLKPGSEIRLLRVLMENGYTNVSFTSGKGEVVDIEKEEEEIDVEAIDEDEEEEVTKGTTPESDCYPEQEGQITNSPDKEKDHSLYSSLTLPTVLWPGQNMPFYNPYLASWDPLKMDIPYLPTAQSGMRHPLINHHSMDTDRPTTTSSGSSSSKESNCLVNGVKLRQRGKQLRRNEREHSAYASCRLCRNRILANRLSNLHNHVRRHAIMKQFHCCYCSYAHTEVAKVRLHMMHNHKDDRSQPLDKRNEDMEAAWSLLMKECFPEYS